MRYAIAALSIGTLLYVGLLAFQSPQARRDRSAWGDRLFISIVIASFLVLTMMWGLFGQLSHATFKSLVDALFAPRPSGLPDLRSMPGFAALAFTVLTGLHVLALTLLS